MPMTTDQYIEHYKKGHTINVMADVMAAAQAKMIDELLDAAHTTLKQALVNSEADVTLLFEGEAKLFEIYKSWDHYNKGRRLTSDELIAWAKTNSGLAEDSSS